MNFKEIQELLRLIAKLELKEFKLKEGDFELSVRSKYHSSGKEIVPVSPVPAPIVSMGPMVESHFASSAPQAAANTPEPVAKAPTETSVIPAASSDSDYLPIKSPIVGTFYRSPSPEKGPYVKVGDKIEAGTVVCIVEAMKLFNEIESEVSGRIVKVLVDDASPVEYDQVLFLVDPKG